MSNINNDLQNILQELQQKGNYRMLPHIVHQNKNVYVNDQRMINLSSNDYLGLSNNLELKKTFLQQLTPESFLPTSSSSRSLTGNFCIYEEAEAILSKMFGAESALLFNSGYHANTGILPAICNSDTLILADKLVHASLIDGIRLSKAQSIRYRHNQLSQLEKLLQRYQHQYRNIIVVTESVFSMDGDKSDLRGLVELKKMYPNVLLYVDEAHAFGVYGPQGLGCAEEADCLKDIDILVGTFGKALASVGAFMVGGKTLRDFLINRMRPFIFTTALPPVNVQWTVFLLQHLKSFHQQREHLLQISEQFRKALGRNGYLHPSSSHIIPLITGDSMYAIQMAEMLQSNGFYALPVRPPTVPEGTSRIRFSLTADLTEVDMNVLIKVIEQF